jgi:hypothetical protein
MMCIRQNLPTVIIISYLRIKDRREMEMASTTYKTIEKFCLNFWATVHRKVIKTRLKWPKAIIREHLQPIHRKVCFLNNYLNNLR